MILSFVLLQHPLPIWHTLLLFVCKETNISDGKVQFITCMADLSFYLNSLRVLVHKMDKHTDKVNVWTKWITTVMGMVQTPALTRTQFWSNILITRTMRMFSCVYTTTFHRSLLNHQGKGNPVIANLLNPYLEPHVQTKPSNIQQNLTTWKLRIFRKGLTMLI